jgi:hypothetical protein
VSKKDELFKKIKELEAAEKRRREEFGGTDKPTRFNNGMPLGCWLWVAFFVWLIYYGVKKYF